MLTKLTVKDVLAQLDNVRRMAELTEDEVGTWEVRVPRNTVPPSIDTVYDVKTVGDTAYLCPVAERDGFLAKAMAIMAGRKSGAMSMDAVWDALAASGADKVAIGWPEGRRSCVCKVLAMTKDGVCTAFLFPGPMDIEKVNEEIAEFRRTHLCPSPDLDCEKCGRLVGCEILEEAEHTVKARREKPLDTDAGTMI